MSFDKDEIDRVSYYDSEMRNDNRDPKPGPIPKA